jgi:ubiquinone/menaquinone biosynthesis C-methylase UbiE
MMNFEKPTVFHVTHWKAGSQWLMKIISELEPERIVPAQVGEVQFLNAPLVKGSIYTPLYLTKEQFHSVPLPESLRKFIVLRDLRDTLVSGYFSLRYSHILNDVRLVRWRRLLNAMTVGDGLMMLMDEWLPASAEIQRSWLQSGEEIIHYEDLLDNAFGILEEVLIGHCGLEISSDRLQQVVSCNQFESLTGGRRPGEEDLSAHERKGISGDWSNHFTPAVHDKFDRLYGDLLAHSLKRVSDQSEIFVGSNGYTSMKTITLDGEEVLEGYDAVRALYPYVPPLSLWRAWERAAYQKFLLGGRILDLGCGDGRYFQLIWPDVNNVVGVDRDPGVADAGLRSGVYRDIHVADAHEVPEQDESFDHVFANCSLEHMDHLDAVLAEVQRCLKPGGSLICSVVTNRFMQWNLLSKLVGMAGFAEAATNLQRAFFEFHHLVNPLSSYEWQQRFRNAGLIPEVHIPILPKFNSGIFLLIDSLWHVRRPVGGELGDAICPFFMENPKFPQAFRSIIAGLLQMETDWQDCSGAVFLVRKPMRISE